MAAWSIGLPLLLSFFSSSSATPSATCTGGVVAHSNVTEATTPCVGAEGDVCPFRCAPGFLAIGIHACQSYTTRQDRVVLKNEFFGGRCEKLCPGRESCPSEMTAVRFNDTTAVGGPCFSTQCLPSPDAALRQLAHGAYRVWRKGRLSRTGTYSGSVNPSKVDGDEDGQSDQAHIGVNGVALVMECVAAEMGWQTVEEAAERVNLTLTALAGELPGFRLTRQAADGWIPTFFNRSTGEALGDKQPYTVLDSGLNSAGVLFARSYFAGKPSILLSSALDQSISRLSKKVFNAVRFEHLLCTAGGRVAVNGTNIPFTLDDTGGCAGLHAPSPTDGFYQFSELHYTVWLAASRNAAMAKAQPERHNPALDTMWERWQGRRTKPNMAYKGFPLLSDWPSYIVQLPFFAAGSFNDDPSGLWQGLFKSHWEADWAYYKTSAYFGGGHGRYGLAAGPTDRWCSAKDGSYEADMLAAANNRTPSEGAQGCRLYSPYAVAGWVNGYGYY